MARDFSKPFYDSEAWRECRKAYRKSVGGLCERCLAKGIVRAADVVHHKIVLTPENVKRPEVTMAWENLEALCHDCHNELHGEGTREAVRRAVSARRNGRRKRWKVGENGTVAPL